MDKQTARKLGLSNRKALSPEVRQKKDAEIFQAVLPYLEKYQSFGCYLSVRNEVSTKEIIRYCLEHQKQVFVPRVAHGTLEFLAYPCELNVSRFGIPEPVGDNVIPVQELECMLVPLSSFDPQWHRTGYGKGYYDSILNDCPLKIGLAYREQMVDGIETDPWDVQLDQVIYR